MFPQQRAGTCSALVAAHLQAEVAVARHIARLFAQEALVFLAVCAAPEHQRPLGCIQLVRYLLASETFAVTVEAIGHQLTRHAPHIKEQTNIEEQSKTASVWEQQRIPVPGQTRQSKGPARVCLNSGGRTAPPPANVYTSQPPVCCVPTV